MGNFLTTGSRVSENREEADDDLNKTNDVNNMESVNDSGPVEDYVMSEASSLLNTKQDHSRDGFHHVGDFVWVEEEGVNRHQWWPGKIYDSSDASDLALKQMQKGTLLVAFCWKQTFAWYNPSQLKPFVENFRAFSKSSGSSSFLSAVREAVTEIGQQVEHMLVCDEPLVSHVAVKNCGVKEGVLVPEVRREIVRSLLVLENPGIVLEDVKSLAERASCSDLLEIEVLKRNISAFYRSKGRFGLAKYDDENPYIIGLEDRGDEFALRKFNKSSYCQRSLRKCSKLASKKRKHGDEVLADVEATTGSTTLRRRVSEVSKIENADLKHVEETRKRKKNGIEKREESKKEESGVSIVVDLSTPLTSLCKRVKVDDVSSSVEGNNGSDETIVQRGKRERKKSKYLSPEYMTDFSWRRRKSKEVESESAEKMRKGSAEILDLIRGAALSTQYSQECKSSYDMIRKFVSIYRSFTYVNGEEAFYKSVEKRPFSTTSTVTLELKNPSSENGNEKKGVTEIEWLKKKLEDMKALLEEAEGGEVTEELKMRLEEESRNLLDRVRKMTVGSS